MSPSQQILRHLYTKFISLPKHTSDPKTPRDWSIPHLGLRFRFLAWDLTSVSCCAASNEQTAARVRHCLGEFLRRGVFTKELGCVIILRYWVRRLKTSRALLCLVRFDTQFLLVLRLSHDEMSWIAVRVPDGLRPVVFDA
jgi:hypothetical protein